MATTTYPITTGLSIKLLDQMERYRMEATKLITTFAFPEDVTIALRQQSNRIIDATIEIVSANPLIPAPVLIAPPVAPPQLTPPLNIFFDSSDVFNRVAPAPAPQVQF